MLPTRFLQIHYLTSFPASLLNRDDVGLAKRIPLGGVTRTRISSQCLKRHWRTAHGQWALSALDVPMSVRSRYTFADKIAPRLAQRGVATEIAVAVLQAFQGALLGESKKAGKAKVDKKKGIEAGEVESADTRDDLQTKQVIILGEAEIDYIATAAQEVAAGIDKADEADKADKAVAAWLTKERIENLRTLRRAAGLDAALFGRMVTSDILARGDAAVHVGHAFTVHRELSETDYFSAVDDLEREQGALGSGHIGEAELTSGLFYGYVVVDVSLLLSNLGDDVALARKTIEHLVHLIATVSPGAKLGSTAPYARAGLLLAERGASQPRSLSDAFLTPVSASNGATLTSATARALHDHVERLDAMYGAEEERVYATYFPDATVPCATDVKTMGALAQWASDVIPSV